MQYRLAVEDLASKGPHFIYNLDDLSKHAACLLKSEAKLFFACKANPLSEVLATLQKTGFCFDVSSEGELLQVVSVGVPGDRIIMTGPAKSDQLLTLALRNRVKVFVIESPTQLLRLQKLAENYDYQPELLLRLQLRDLVQKKSVLGGGTETTAFGMDVKTARLLLPKVRLPLLGFHVFQWNQILSVDKLRSLWTAAIRACQAVKKDIAVVDLGGGLGIPYQSEAALDWTEVKALLSELKHAHNLQELWIEMGRYVTGPFGFYITKVIDRKRTYEEDILVLEGGINHIARPALLNQYFPVSLLRESRKSKQTFGLHGPLCTSLDFLGAQDLPSDTSTGDTLLFHQLGAYGFTESMPFFLCHPLPGEAVIKQGKLSLIRENQFARSWLK